MASRKDKSGGVLDTARRVVSGVVDTAASVVGQAGETAAGLATSALETAAGAVSVVSPTVGEAIRPAPSTERAIDTAARGNKELLRAEAEAAREMGEAAT